jgi:hypothetical protein
LRQGGEFNFKEMLSKQDSEDKNGADSQLDQPAHSEDYPAPSSNEYEYDSEEDWQTREGVLYNIEQMVE